MKKIIISFFILIFMVFNSFSEEWVSEKGQKLIFLNQTAIIFNDKLLSEIGPEITKWKNAIMSLSIDKSGNLFCDIKISTDDYKLSRTQDWIRYTLYTKLYYNIEDENQKDAFLSLGFIVRFRNEFSRGSIEQYAALQQRYGMVVVYPDTHLEASSYTAELNYNSNYDLFPKYNEISQSWNAAYLYCYIIGDFEAIKDMPVPPGLDDSFKKEQYKKE